MPDCSHSYQHGTVTYFCGRDRDHTGPHHHNGQTPAPMTEESAANVQALLEHLHFHVDPLTLTPNALQAAFLLARTSSAVLGHGYTTVSLWAQHEPLEGYRP